VYIIRNPDARRKMWSLNRALLVRGMFRNHKVVGSKARMRGMPCADSL
jgi:hypothetical protein